MAGLTAKQQAFAYAVAVDGLNASAAYRRCYNAGAMLTTSVGREATRLMANPAVATEIATLRTPAARAAAAVLEARAIDTAWVLERSVELVDRSMQAVPARDRDGNESGQWQFDGANANRALDRIGRYTGGFSERVEHSGPGGGPIPVALLQAFAQLTPAQLETVLDQLGELASGEGIDDAQ